jgi:hypothetical protein
MSARAIAIHGNEKSGERRANLEIKSECPALVYTRKFCQDPWYETRRCPNSCFFYLYNIRGLYTQILSRPVIRNTQMPKKLFLLCSEARRCPFFLPASYTTSGCGTTDMVPSPCSEARRCPFFYTPFTPFTKYPELLYIYINVAVHVGKALCFGYKEAIVLLKTWNKHFPKGTVSWDFLVLVFSHYYLWYH